jgi:aryl-alcohol dehydrogenase-like predicted oxidoreductase
VTDMRFRRLGDSGLMVSVVGIGCNNFGGRIDDSRAEDVVHTALDLGINLFDTADSYGLPPGASEIALGKALGKRRDEAVVATKFGNDVKGAYGLDWNARGSRRYVMKAVEQSLRNLGTDHLDLYQFHKPDPLTPIEETLSALDDLVRAGKVRYLGNSNFSGWQVADAAWTAKTKNLAPFVSAQNYYSLINRDVERDLVPAAERFGLGLLPYFPLESGLLSGKYRRGEAAAEGTRMSNERFAPWLERAPWDKIEALEQFAKARDLTILDLAIGGLAAKPTVASVIAGATTGDQVRANAAAGSWEPTADELAEIDRLTA